jgi:hypothetical protein
MRANHTTRFDNEIIDGLHELGVPAGKALGSFEQWSRWVRDPLLALGCQDVAERVGEAKERDGRRQVITDLFMMWWAKHGNRPMRVADLHEDVKSIMDPHGRGRQFQASFLTRLDSSRIAGFMLTRQAPAGQWGDCELRSREDRSR